MLETRGCMVLALKLTALIGREECGQATKEEVYLLRLFTPVAKLYTAKKAMSVMSEGLENFCGQGYIEGTGLPTLFTDAQQVERERERLLLELFPWLNDQCQFHRVSINLQWLCVHRLRVYFSNEEGEGSGVLCSFFTPVYEAVISESPLPELDHRFSNSVQPISFKRSF